MRVETEALARKLLGLNDDWSVLFLQGGATAHFDLIPMNFLQTKAQYIDTGTWATSLMRVASHGAVEVIGSSKDINAATGSVRLMPKQIICIFAKYTRHGC